MAQPTPAIKYFISHFPAIFVIAKWSPTISNMSTDVFKNSWKIKKNFSKIISYLIWIFIKVKITIPRSNFESSNAGKNVASRSILQNWTNMYKNPVFINFQNTLYSALFCFKFKLDYFILLKMFLLQNLITIQHICM